MKLYLKVDLSVSFHDRQLCPLLCTRVLEAQCIKDVFSGVKRWESMPNRRETVTVKMVLYIHKKCANKRPDSLESIPYDWIALCIFYYFRLSEWAQNASDKTQPLTGTDGLPLSFIVPDLTFLGTVRSTISHSWSAQLHDTGIKIFQFRWRMQKTLINDKCISQGKNADPRLCPILASLWTQKCAHRLNTSEH